MTATDGCRRRADAGSFGGPTILVRRCRAVLVPRIAWKPAVAASRPGLVPLAITDGFERRCAITGEKTLPILDAAHIKTWAFGGENRPGNGLLLRTDIHRLFDLGYVTLGHDHRFEVSPRLREDYENGKEYYGLNGRLLRSPLHATFLPSTDALDWHHTNRWASPGEHF